MSTEIENKGKTRADIVNSLNKPPLKSGIRVRDGRAYVLISTVEKGLDILFGPFGWEMENFTYQVVVNEMVGSVDLLVKDPESEKWIRRVGTGAVMIQLRKGSSVLDVGSKIPNCMESGMGHLLSDCLKNAAAKLGKHLGRDIGRKDEDKEQYTAIIQEWSDRLRSAMASLTSAEDVKVAFNTVPASIRAFDEIQDVYKAKQRDLERNHLQQLNA